MKQKILLKIEDIYKNYGKLEVLKGISFTIEKAQTKVLIGPSGSGKSTILRCINMLSPPDKGKIFLEDIEITNSAGKVSKVRQKIGMVFQHFNLFKHLKAIDNVRIGLTKVKGWNKKEATEQAMEELRRVGLADKAQAYPAELSGGQQQRVGIARALALDPELILFDEPTSALDPELIGEVLNVMIDLAKSGMTMLVVTHEMGFARSVSEEIIFIEDGIIIEEGPPEQFFKNAKNERTRKFLNKIEDLYGKIED